MSRGPAMLQAPRNLMRKSSFLSDIAMLVGLPGPQAASPQPYVPPLTDVQDVLAVLQAPRARKNPPYVLSVLKTYVRPRVSRRRSRVEDDLLFLARECPEFAPEFRAILKHYRLPLPAELLRDTTPESPGATPHGGSPYSPYHTVPLPRRARHVHMPFMQATPHAPVERLVTPTADPPPPYASEDPDPDNTAVMALRLAAQSRIGLGDVAAIAQSSRVDLVELAARSQMDLHLLAQSEREQEDYIMYEARTMPLRPAPRRPVSMSPQATPPQLRRRHASAGADFVLRTPPPPPRTPQPVARSRAEAWRASLAALEGPPPRPPRSSRRPPALRLSQLDRLDEAETAEHAAPLRPSPPRPPLPRFELPMLQVPGMELRNLHRRSTPTPPRAPRRDNRATLNLSAATRRLAMLAKRASYVPPRPPRRSAMPMIPPLELGTLDFEREFEELEGWFNARAVPPIPTREELGARPARGRRRDEPFDVAIASVMATEG